MLSVQGLVVKRSESFSLTIGELELADKKILCVTGPNGSGKTTFIQCLAGILTPSRGSITLDGQAVCSQLRSVRTHIGYIPDEEDWFVKELSAKEYFELLESVYRKAGVSSAMQKQVRRLAKILHFTMFDQPLANLSHGNKKKVQIIAGLLHQPKIIIADELRNGLDPLSIIAVEQILRAEAKRGACIVAATHDLWWAERVAHNIVVLDNGQPTLHQKTSKIVKQYGSVEKLFLQLVQGNAHAAAV
jgi:ABC-2 type transport system ATP-binding protein